MIRALADDDLDAFIALRQRALRECPLAFSSSAENDFASSRESLLPQIAKAPEWMLFGAFDGTLAGSVGLFRARHAKAGHRMQLWGMYVAPEARGRGFGALLLDTAISHARGLGDVAWIDLGVTDAAPAAQRLYKRAGFAVWGVQRDVLRAGGRAVDESHMALRLGTDATVQSPESSENARVW